MEQCVVPAFVWYQPGAPGDRELQARHPPAMAENLRRVLVCCPPLTRVMHDKLALLLGAGATPLPRR